MGTKLTQRQEEKLIGAIQAEHEACSENASRALQHALACGDLLIQAKESVVHGGWQDWLTMNFASGIRTAQLYMKLASNREKLEGAISSKTSSDALLSISQAAKLIAPPKPKSLTPLEDRGYPKRIGTGPLSEWTEPHLPPLGEMVCYLMRGQNCAAQLVPAEWDHAYHVSVWRPGEEGGDYDRGSGTIRPVCLDHDRLALVLTDLGFEWPTKNGWLTLPEPAFPHPSAL